MRRESHKNKNKRNKKAGKNNAKKKKKKKKKEEEEEARTMPMCKCTWAFWSAASHPELFSPQFSPYFGEKAFWWVQGENIRAYHFFSLFPPNQTITKNAIFPLFFPQFSILLKIPPNKHTLKVRIQTLDVTLQLEPFLL